MGNLNYEIYNPNMTSAEVIKDLTSNISAGIAKYKQFDEFLKYKREAPWAQYREGYNNEGPNFLPTWRLARNRGADCIVSDNTNSIPPSCYNVNKTTLGGIGWKDRIIYMSSDPTKNIHCLRYFRVDNGNMRYSENAAVLGMYQIMTGSVPSVNYS